MTSYMKIILNCPASQLNPFKYKHIKRDVKGLYYVNKWNVSQNVSMVPRVEKAKSSQSFDYEFVILFYYFLWLDSSFCKVL